jgi:hypothetical protein
MDTSLALIKPNHNSTIPYDEAVIKGKKIMLEIGNRQWELADLANHLEPKYGEQTLARYAIAIDVKYRTLQKLRSVARAWPQMTRARNISFGIAADLMAQADREQIVEGNPLLTQGQARTLIKDRRKELEESGMRVEEREEEVILPYQEPCTDCNSAVEQWQRSVGNFLGDVVTMRAYWDHLFGAAWRQFPVTSTMLKLVIDAKKEIHEIVAELHYNKEHPHEKD